MCRRYRIADIVRLFQATNNDFDRPAALESDQNRENQTMAYNRSDWPNRPCTVENRTRSFRSSRHLWVEAVHGHRLQMNPALA